MEVKTGMVSSGTILEEEEEEEEEEEAMEIGCSFFARG